MAAADASSSSSLGGYTLLYSLHWPWWLYFWGSLIWNEWVNERLRNEWIWTCCAVVWVRMITWPRYQVRLSKNWKFWPSQSVMISRSRIVAHCVSCASFAGLAGRWITRGSLWRVSWSAGRILSVSWERVDGGQADEGVPGQHEAVDRCGLQWGEWSIFYVICVLQVKFD